MKPSRKYTRDCGDTEPHQPHEYMKHWRLIDLPLLPDPHRYPAEWDSRYACPGVKLPGRTWAESLGLNIPDNAPGGQRLLPRGGILGSRRSPSNRGQIEYEGFHDNDAYRRDADG